MTDVDSLCVRPRQGPDIDLMPGEVRFGIRIPGEYHRCCCCRQGQTYE